MNIEKQINYWVEGAREDIISAELLIKNNRLLHGLFWCHLTIEKIIKAHVVKSTLQIPPLKPEAKRILESTKKFHQWLLKQL